MSAVRVGRRRLAALGAGAIALGAPGRAAAADFRVLAAGAVRLAVEKLGPEFGAREGHKVEMTFDTVGAIRDRALAGEQADVVLVSAPALKALEGKGRLAPGTTRIVGRTGVGLAGPRNGPELDISTPEKLKAALLAAPTVGYADPARGPTAGIHFQSVLRKLGIEEQIRPKAVLRPTGIEAVDAVADGACAIASSQATEIVAHPGVRMIGLLPESLQLWTEYGVAALAPKTAAADAFIAALFAPDGEAAFKRIGFER